MLLYPERVLADGKHDPNTIQLFPLPSSLQCDTIQDLIHIILANQWIKNHDRSVFNSEYRVIAKAVHIDLKDDPQGDYKEKFLRGHSMWLSGSDKLNDMPHDFNAIELFIESDRIRCQCARRCAVAWRRLLKETTVIIGLIVALAVLVVGTYFEGQWTTTYGPAGDSSDRRFFNGAYFMVTTDSTHAYGDVQRRRSASSTRYQPTVQRSQRQRLLQ